MKSIRTVGSLLATLVAVAVLVWVALDRQPDGRVDPARIFAATKAYSTQLESRGAPVPAEVPLEQLIATGLLRESDVSGFAGMKVTVALRVDTHNPQQVLMRARTAQGDEIVALNDGSVQQLKR